MNTNTVLFFASALFMIGAFGVVVRRNILIMMMSVELMLNAANLSFVALAREHGDLGGQMAVFFIITVAAAEAAIGLGLLIAYFRNQTSVNTDQMQLLKE